MAIMVVINNTGCANVLGGFEIEIKRLIYVDFPGFNNNIVAQEEVNGFIGFGSQNDGQPSPSGIVKNRP